MGDDNFRKKVISATKWSVITQIASKLIVPVTNMILARILVPEAFGVIATITMIISFVDMFTDAGFQKYLIQHEFKDNKERNNYSNVAFWSNFITSIFLWAIISLFSDEIANMVGSPGLGLVITLSCIQLPLTAFSSIQMSLFRRDFDFKTLFIVRIISIFIPVIITIPLALIGLSYWSLIIGNIVMQLFNAIMLTCKSKWRPSLYYNFEILKKMLSFSIWSLIEAFSIWLTAWVDAFIIGYYLTEYYLGIYKTSTTMVNSLLALVTASIVPVLFSTLSRLQNKKAEFKKVYFKFQRMVAVIIFPIGVGVFLYSDLATKLLLGSQWTEANEIIGIWALTSIVMIVFGHFCSEVYRANGKPKLSFIAQVLHLVVLVPTVIITVKYGFWTLIYARSLVRIQFVFVHLGIMKFKMDFSIRQTLKNTLSPIIAVCSMWVIGSLLNSVNDSLMWDVFSIFICAISYCIILFIFPDMRKELLIFIVKFLPLNKSNKLNLYR